MSGSPANWLVQAGLEIQSLAVTKSRALGASKMQWLSLDSYLMNVPTLPASPGAPWIADRMNGRSLPDGSNQTLVGHEMVVCIVRQMVLVVTGFEHVVPSELAPGLEGVSWSS
jgi:hypothetical protein